MKKWIFGLIALLVVGALFYASQTSKKTTASVDTSASGKVLAVGSTALQPLAESAGELYHAKNKNVEISVQGGGSGAGLTQVSAGSVQIGNSDVFAEEKEGIDASTLTDHKVAVVGIAPVVNKDVTVTNLSKQQLIDIFTGKVTNWNQVGGSDLPIVVINRASGSGTRTVFEKTILNGAQAINAQEQDSNGTVQQLVSSTPGSISYLAFGFMNTDGIKTISVDNVKPEAKNVATNDWKIWGYEHMYTKGEGDAATKAYINFFSDSSVEASITKLGYIPLSNMKVEKDATGAVKNK